MLRTNDFRPCRGAINATSYPGARASGYYLSAPPGLCCAGADGVSRQINWPMLFLRATLVHFVSKTTARGNRLDQLTQRSTGQSVLFGPPAILWISYPWTAWQRCVQGSLSGKAFPRLRWPVRSAQVESISNSPRGSVSRSASPPTLP